MKFKTTFILTMVLLFLLSTISFATGRALITSYVKQAKSNWCWAACAENSIKWEMNPTRTQWTAVKYLKGTSSNSYPNVSGSLSDSVKASEYISAYTEDYGYTYSTYSYNFLKSEIEYSNYIQLGAGYYSGSVRNGGHIVCMYGYDTTSSKIKYIDSATNSRKTCTYSAFCNGSYNGRRYDQTVYNKEYD